MNQYKIHYLFKMKGGIIIKEELRIIYYDRDDDYRPIKIADVIDFGDRFITDNPEKDYYGGYRIKKDYLTWTEATPEKEKIVAEYYRKRKELDEFRVNMHKFVFKS